MMGERKNNQGGDDEHFWGFWEKHILKHMLLNVESIILDNNILSSLHPKLIVEGEIFSMIMTFEDNGY